jgi:hypothetical protein
VTALALCKLNKNEMYTGQLSQRARHQRPSDLFWHYHEVPEEALGILQVSRLPQRHYTDSAYVNQEICQARRNN